MKVIRLAGTCSAGGVLAKVTGQNVTGYIEKVEMDYVDGDTGADLTFTVEGITSQALLTVTNAGTADAVWYPRHTGNKAADASAYTNWATKHFLNAESVGVSVAQGGNAKDFVMLIHVSDGLQ
jgi:hypothetical protein